MVTSELEIPSIGPDVRSTDISRRVVLGGSALLSLSAATAACAEPGAPRADARSKALVVYFTRSGNTRVIAGSIQRAVKADMFEIRAATAYPEDYEQTVARAKLERDNGTEPALVERVEGIADYETIFLGFPIWGETAPPVIRSFLRQHDLNAKSLRPFITHGGYGLGSSRAVLASHAPGARIEPPFVMEADQERRTLNQVNGWLEKIGFD